MSTILKSLLICGAAFVILFGCKSQEKKEDHHEKEKHSAEAGVIEINKEGQEKAGLKFAAVQEASITNLLRVSGKVVPDESRVVHIRPLAAGRVEKIYITPGSTIAQGQSLVAIDYVDLGELQNSYAKALAAAEVTEQAQKRAEHLTKIGALPQSEYERRKADHQNSIAELNDIEFKLARYNVKPAQLKESSTLTHGIMRSPRNGVLLEFDAAEGELVEPEHALFTIADLSLVWIEANVHETDLSLVQVGQKAEVRSDAYPGEVFTGMITKVGDMLDVSTRTIKVRCEVPNPETRLKLEMFVHVIIPTSKTRKALLVPNSAVQEIDHKPVVYVKEGESHFRKRNIQTGETSDSGIEVVSGLKPNEMVVTEGSFSLKSEFLKAEIGSDEHGH